jgi:hypothetical protein
MKILILLAIVVAVAIIMPIATIWSLNALFPALAIPLTIDTWMATLILSGIVSGSSGFTYRGNK